MGSIYVFTIHWGICEEGDIRSWTSIDSVVAGCRESAEQLMLHRIMESPSINYFDRFELTDIY